MLKKILGHFTTITRHRHLVIRHCVRAGILWQGLRHDLSKYSPTEFLPGVLFFDGHHSPTEDERKEHGCSLAWMHHKGRNLHHWEYWRDINPQEHRYEPVVMPRRYVGEMICDRMAASKVYNGDAYTDRSPLEYLLRGKNTMDMHPQTMEELVHFLTVLAESGEDAMFRELRTWIRDR